MMKKKLIMAISAAVLAVAAITVLIVVLLGNNGGSPSGNKVEGPETGVYYFDAKYDEYTLTLNGGDMFTLVVKGEISFGSYTLTDGVLTLDFNEDGKENASAMLADGVVTLTYGDASMRLLKKVNYTVTFELLDSTGKKVAEQKISF